MRILGLILFPIAGIWAQTSATFDASFDASGADRLRISTPRYELVLNKANGAILGITDRAATAAMPIASRNGCLWGASYQGGAYQGGCNLSAVYHWDAVKSILTLRYSSMSASATVTIGFSSNWFDAKLAIENHMGATLQTVVFPSDMVLEASSVQAAYIPYYLPGARLNAKFFSTHRSISVIYPSARAFADYLAVDYAGGRLAWYAINPGGKIAPVQLGFKDDDKTKAGTFYTFHAFQAWTRDGGTFTTPIVRFQVGATPSDSITTYREANGILAYPNLQDKLGSLAPTLLAAPLVKVDFRGIHRTFGDLSTRLALVRSPAILHPVSYWPVGFDRNYPDFLPPDPQFGTMADFRAFVDAAHARGLLVMPYTNPTWWDDQSPTAKSAPDLAALAVIGLDGKPVFEHYAANHGFVPSPSSPAVQQRLAALMSQWRKDVPVDLVLQDQIGSRSWLRDFNPAASDPQGYSDAWLAFTRQFANQRLMTEDGWDRIAATETGFTGSLLTGTTVWNPTGVRWGEHSRGNQAFGAGQWEPYPLADWLFHDKVLFYHHDLDHTPMNAGVEVLTWNAAFGVMAGYLWPELHTSHPDWPAIAAAFQPAVMSRTAGIILSEYRTLADEVTESRFGDLTVVANWNAGSTYAVDGYTVAPSGCLARSGDGSVIGGVFVDRFSGASLTPGVHYLLIERLGGKVTVRQPSGPDTPITVRLPAEWDLSKGVQVTPPVKVAIDGAQATLIVAASVEHYEIAPVSAR